MTRDLGTAASEVHAEAQAVLDLLPVAHTTLDRVSTPEQEDYLSRPDASW